MSNDKNPLLAEHFERLKATLPEVYRSTIKPNKTSLEKLCSLLRNSLGVIEAMYLQNPDSFSSARIGAYSSIVHELRGLGVAYKGNSEILNKAIGHTIMQNKKPMKKAGLPNAKIKREAG